MIVLLLINYFNCKFLKINLDIVHALDEWLHAHETKNWYLIEF